MSVFELPDFDAHEAVVHVCDAASGLKAIIAIHNTRRGPAMGGSRMWRYADSTEAATDALRLSRGMTYKNAMANLPIGGGKAVIIGDARSQKTPELFRALGRAVESLGGRYITAEDVGTAPADMHHVRETTRYVAGLSGELGGQGDPSPATALGVFVGLGAAARHRLGADSVKGLHVAIQGLGHVGFDLARQLHEAGARLTVTDIDRGVCLAAAEAFGASVVAPEEIVDVEADVFAPCALGASLNPLTLPRLKCRVVAGAANNQLATDDIGDRLRDAGILYAPDYVINAGGIIKVCAEYFGESPHSVEGRVRAIADTLADVFARADKDGIATNRAADELARQKLA
ncbi:Leu/Phe/Val dehydrogenase [Paludibacterium paludis]|uniref:Amino acid dehydrogenase n=1 Tax=Paludibacterium paludis TaxID=1225769 RepID=A0A918UBR5_9NEIS|nr:Glu/Leu/Phe/Val dehydrogenase [Paludibacterium paludis]GGY26250.1 amino acid dehydrogenase [Paludibacterium paludis]